MKKIWIILSIILMATMALSACAKEPVEEVTTEEVTTEEETTGEETTAAEPLKIGIATDAGYPARIIEVLGIHTGAAADGNEVIEQNADNDSAKQAQQIKALVDQGVDAIVVCAVDMNAIQTSLDYAASKGVIVTLYDRFVDNPNVAFTGGYNSYNDGIMAGKELAKFDTDDEPKVVFELVGNLADTNALARRDGFHSVIDTHEDIQVVQILTDWDTNTALSGMENALQKYPEVWGIYNASSHMDGSIKTALEEAGRLAKVGEEGHVYWVAIGEEPPGPQIGLEGYKDALLPIPFDQIGTAIYEAIKILASGGTLVSDVFYAETYVITSDEVAAQYDDIWAIKFAEEMGQ